MGNGQSDVPMDELCDACSRGDVEVARKILDAGVVGVNGRNPASGWTPLHYACEANRFGVAEILLQKGADVNALTKDAWEATPLHLALSGNPQPLMLVVLLLQHGANAKTSNSEGTTPLHLALAVGDYLTVRALLKKGAVVDEKCAKVFVGDERIRKAISDAREQSDFQITIDAPEEEDHIPLLQEQTPPLPSSNASSVPESLRELQSNQFATPKAQQPLSDIEIACRFLQTVRMVDLDDATLGRLNSFYATQLERTIASLKARQAGGGPKHLEMLLDDEDDDDNAGKEEEASSSTL